MKVYLDTETTGLDDRIHQAYEVAWVFEGEGLTPSRADIPHTLAHADPFALRIGNYWDRGFNPWDASDKPEQWRGMRRRLLLELRGATLIGSNPDFDKRFLRSVLGAEVWHHRTIDVSQMGATIFGWDEPRGLAAVVEELRSLGRVIDDPDHTALGDVLVTRQVHLGLLGWQSDIRSLAGIPA